MSFLMNFLTKFFSDSGISAGSSSETSVEDAKSATENESSDFEFLPGSGLKNYNMPSNPGPFFHDNDFIDSI